MPVVVSADLIMLVRFSSVISFSCLGTGSALGIHNLLWQGVCSLMARHVKKCLTLF